LAALLYELREGLRGATDAIAQNKLRSVLTTLGIVIGIVMVTSTMTTINGMERAFDRSMEMFGTNTYYVTARPWIITSAEEWFEMQRRPRFTYEVAQRVQAGAERSDEIQRAAISLDFGGTISYRDRHVSGIQATATTPAYTEIADLDLSEGRYFTDFEETSARNVVVIGADVAESLFTNEQAIGKEVRIQGERFTVVGVLARKGKFLGMFSVDEQFQIPLATARKLYNTQWWNYTVNLKARAEVEEQAVEDEVRGFTRVARGQDALDDDNFAINRTEIFRDLLGQTKAIIYGVGLFLTALALVVGGIGVMNIMFVSVKERTREIGLRKAIGAKRRTILLQFLLEAVTVSLLGGVIGLILSLGTTLVINQVFTASLSPVIVVLALAVCVGVGVTFGFLPAWQAARQRPIDALRYE
jgi:putative ABC transport system permease protein